MPPAERIIGEADDVAALGDAGQFAVIVERLRVSRAAERAAGAVELVIAVEREARGRRSHRLAGPVAHRIDDVAAAVGVGSGAHFAGQARSPIVAIGDHRAIGFRAGLAPSVGIEHIAEGGEDRAAAGLVCSTAKMLVIIVRFRGIAIIYRCKLDCRAVKCFLIKEATVQTTPMQAALISICLKSVGSFDTLQTIYSAMYTAVADTKNIRSIDLIMVDSPHSADRINIGVDIARR